MGAYRGQRSSSLSRCLRGGARIRTVLDSRQGAKPDDTDFHSDQAQPKIVGNIDQSSAAIFGVQLVRYFVLKVLMALIALTP